MKQDARTPRKENGQKLAQRERKYSNSLWHADWHTIRDPRWSGSWLVAYEDDASRFIVGFGNLQEPTSNDSVAVLNRAVNLYGKPALVEWNYGSAFNFVESRRRENGMTEFERYILQQKIRLILGEIAYSRTNGKIGRFFSIFDKTIKYFPSISEFVAWYNNSRPHGSLRLETPVRAYHKRKVQLDLFSYPSYLENSVEVISEEP